MIASSTMRTGYALLRRRLDLNGIQTGVLIENQGNTQAVHFNDVFLNLIGQDGIVLGAASGTATQESAGLVQIDMLRTNQNAGNVGRYVVNYVDAGNSSSLVINGGMLWLVNNGALPYINIPQAVSAGKISISEHLQSDLANPSLLYGATTVSCTGLGSGTCSLSGSLRSSPWSGTIILSPAGSPSSSGAATLSFPEIVRNNVCMASYDHGTTRWSGESVIDMVNLTNVSTQIQWAQTNPLTAGNTYLINFSCLPQ